jgi:phosphohistidine swiveling domain-containing protein
VAEISTDVRGSTSPDRCWTFTNAREASPLVLTTLEWAIWSRAVELGARGAWHDFGFLPGSEVRQSAVPDECISSSFYGRQAINVDLCRQIMGQIPGSSADDFERDMLGSVRPDATPVPNSLRRLPAILMKAPRVLATQTRAVERRHTEQLAWWRGTVLATETIDPLKLLEDAHQRFVDTMRIHVRSRTLLQGLQAQVTALCERAGQPELASSVLSGYGGVTETDIAQDLWDVASGSLTVDSFIAAHGYHGPSEGNPRSTSWREQPSLVETLAASMRARGAADDPRRREAAAVARRESAERDILAALPRSKRATARMMFRAAGTQVRNLELGKAAYVAAIDGCRRAVRERGAWLAEQGHLGEPSEVFHLTLDELRSPSGSYAAVVAARAAEHAEFEDYDPPVTFIGMPVPNTAASTDTSARSLTAAAGAPGVVEGVVRVVRDPDDGDDLGEGEILVCSMTDPGWAPLMSLAAGLVIDIGGPSSHGAIVARELGVPCVIGTGHGTTWLRTGDRVRIDGSAGLVERLSPVDADSAAI